QNRSPQPGCVPCPQDQLTPPILTAADGTHERARHRRGRCPCVPNAAFSADLAHGLMPLMRRRELGLVLLLLGGCRAATVDVTQQPIVGGTPTTAYPFVGYVSADYGSSSSGCTGTLVRDKWVLTAAHCIEETDGKVRGVKVTFEADSDHATMW